MKRYILFCLVLLITFSTSSYGLTKQIRVNFSANGEWTVLGTRHIKRGVEKDVIAVGIKEGGFTKLKIKVTGGRVNMHHMLVTYGNGKTEEIELRKTFRKGSTSRIVDINGRRRIIKRITFVYDRSIVSRSARIWVAAKK